MNKYLLMSVLSVLAFPAYADVESFVNAAKVSDVKQVRELLRAGENVNVKNSLGNTALHYAVANGNADMVKFLLDKGADPLIQNDKGWTPLSIAEKKNLGDISKMLSSAQDNKDLTALVEQVSETAKDAEQKVSEIKENLSEKTEVAQEKAEEKIAEVKAEVDQAKQNVQQKVAEMKESAQNKTDEVKKEIKEDLTAASDKAKEAEQKVEKAAQEAEQKVEKAAQEAEQKVEKAAQEAEQKVAKEVADVAKPVVKGEPKAEVKKQEVKSETKEQAKPALKQEVKQVVKPVAAKPEPKPVPSKIIKDIFAGDEEIAYCLYYLGLQTEQHNLTDVAEFFAGTTTINKARFDKIADMAHKYYDNASEAEMQSMAGICSKIITPQNKDKQNQIIRAMNKAIGY